MLVTLNQIMAGDVDLPGEKRLTWHELGELAVTSGAISICDPMISYPWVHALLRTVPAGRHPVRLMTDGRDPAFLMVRFNDRPIVRWELALAEEERIDNSYPVHCVPGFLVESAKVGVFDYAAQGALEPARDALYAAIHGRSAGGVACAVASLPGRDQENIALVSVGADGLYTTYFGVTADNQAAVLITPLGYDYLKPPLFSDEHLQARAHIVAQKLQSKVVAERKEAIAELRGLRERATTFLPDIEKVLLTSKSEPLHREAGNTLVQFGLEQESLRQRWDKALNIGADSTERRLALKVAERAYGLLWQEFFRPRVLNLALTTRDGRVASMAALVVVGSGRLIGGGDPDCDALVSAMVPLLQRRDKGTRERAAKVCAQAARWQNHDQARQALLNLVDDPNPTVRAQAAGIVGHMAGNAGYDLSPIEKFLADTDAGVVLAAAYPFCTSSNENAQARGAVEQSLKRVLDDASTSAKQRDIANRYLRWLRPAGKWRGGGGQ